MRQRRLKLPPDRGTAFYHCISRVVDRQFLFTDLHKEQFISFMREYEAFCEVRVVTFCIMSNHFHLLLEVPTKPSQAPSDDELLAKVESLTGVGGGGTTRQLLERFREQGHHDAAEALRAKLMARMWDVSAFMKLLKQRFTQWFNNQRGRRGTLWEERFKSVLVEGAGDALAAIAAYIDLNPVRAGLVTDPKDYRWCGYAEALAGKRRAKEGLRLVMAGAQRTSSDDLSLAAALKQYRMWVFGLGEENTGMDEQGNPLRLGITSEKVAEVLDGKGSLSIGEYVRVRVRYFADGAVLGTKAFVDDVFHAMRSRYGPNRKDGGRRLKGVDSQNLYAMRDLQVNPIG